MKPQKQKNREEASKKLFKAGIKWVSFNNDLHWRIDNCIDFYPTTGKWSCSKTNEFGFGVEDLIEHCLQPKEVNVVKNLSVNELFDVARLSKNKSLMGICESIHKAVYGS